MVGEPLGAAALIALAAAAVVVVLVWRGLRQSRAQFVAAIPPRRFRIVKVGQPPPATLGDQVTRGGWSFSYREGTDDFRDQFGPLGLDTVEAAQNAGFVVEKCSAERPCFYAPVWLNTVTGQQAQGVKTRAELAAMIQLYTPRSVYAPTVFYPRFMAPVMQLRESEPA